MSNSNDSDIIFHIALARDWETAQRAGSYRVSTRGATLDDVGFIHASFDHQVARTGELFYADAGEPLVVLIIDTARLDAPIKIESAHGGDERFPHIHGPLPTSAVIDVRAVTIMADGRFLIDGGTRQ